MMKKGIKRGISAALIVLFAGAASCAGWFGYQHFRENAEYERHEADVAEIRDEVIGSPIDNYVGQEEFDSHDPIYRTVDFDALQAVNKDATRWIYIPDSVVDYPVMQERTIGQYYYIWRDVYGKKSNTGSLLTPALPENSTDPHLLIFGHSFVNNRDALFTMIKNYYDISYFDTHPYVYLYYPDRTERWLAVEVKNVMAQDIVYAISYKPGSDEYADLQEHLFSSGRQRLMDKINGITPDDPLLILSCCDRKYNYNNGRAILICRLAEVFDTETKQITKVYPAPAEN